MMRKYLLSSSLILLLSAVTTYTDKHSHYFFITVTDDSNYDRPSYYTTRSIDDITLYWYDSISEVIERRVPWFRSTYSTLLDASANQFMMQQSLQRLFRMFKNYLNETKGFHVLQRLLGCIVYGNGTIGTVFSYRYDGRPFLSFNVEKGHWIAEDSRVQYFADIFNRNKTMGEQNKKVLMNNCVPHIAELLSLGNCTFNRREKPIVRVTQTPITNSTSRLNCRAYGHYPKNISMTWYKNGEPVPENLTEQVTLPFPDITYLTCLTLNITPTNGDVYTCSVDHSSMMLPFREDWSLSEEIPESHIRGLSNGVIIATCLAVILLVVLIVFGSVSIGKSRIRTPKRSKNFRATPEKI